jgi:hypothetical protein
MGRFTPEQVTPCLPPSTGYHFRWQEVPIREPGNDSVKQKQEKQSYEKKQVYSNCISRDHVTVSTSVAVQRG